MCSARHTTSAVLDTHRLMPLLLLLRALHCRSRGCSTHMHSQSRCEDGLLAGLLDSLPHLLEAQLIGGGGVGCGIATHGAAPGHAGGQGRGSLRARSAKVQLLPLHA
eukprot:719769-Pelagomonas_calceolata.AAC.3